MSVHGITVRAAFDVTLRTPAALIAGACAAAVALPALGQSMGPDFAASYTIVDVGSVPGVPANYGGLLFAPGDTSVLFIGGQANGMSAQIYAVVVSRGPDGGITGFNCGTGVPFAAAPGVGGGIDGGLDVGPGSVLFYTTYPDNRLGQIPSNATAPSKLIDLGTLGVAASTGALRFVPANFPGAGRLKIVSYSGSLWYDATVSADGNGTWDVSVSPGSLAVGGGPEGIAYVKGGNPGFANDSVLVAQYNTGSVVAFEIDANGDPVLATARTFVSGLSGAEGAAIDPVTGDFVFSTYGGGNRVLRVTGFTTVSTCPGDIDLSGGVNGADLGILLAEWGAVGGSPADLNGDCVVDGSDLGVLLGNWGPCLNP